MSNLASHQHVIQGEVKYPHLAPLRATLYRVIHYEMHNPTKCIIFSLIISPLLPASTMTTSTKAYRMQLALAELKQQKKPNISATSKKYQLIQSTLYRRWKRETYILYKNQLRI